jgi:predicted lipoprotein with Yx(FWY)xxD motif
MRRLIAPGLALAASLALAACGGGGGGGGTSSAGAAAASTTVSIRQLSGVGSVLVDSAGKAVYTSDVEAGGKIVCDGACKAFWKPVTTDSAKPTAPAEAGKLGVLKRPDGDMQVTANGQPLYTFAEDSPGKVTGDGFTDDFSGHHFTWHVVNSGGNAASGAGSDGGGAGSGGSTKSDYGY